MPDLHVVMGVRLRPFCFAHWLRLSGSPFLFGGEIGISDLLMGVLVCSETGDGFDKATADGGAVDSVKRWGWRLSGGWRGLVRRALFRHVLRRTVTPEEVCGFSFLDECAKFQNYLDQYGVTGNVVNDWSRPTTMMAKKQGDGKPELHTPDPALLFIALTTVLGCSDKEAKEMPLPQARWRWAIHAERTGMASIVDVDKARDEQEMANNFVKQMEQQSDVNPS